MLTYYGLNESEKKQLLQECRSRSRMIPDKIHYALYRDGGCSATITTDEKKAVKMHQNGYKVYCKMLDGQMIL